AAWCGPPGPRPTPPSAFGPGAKAGPGGPAADEGVRPAEQHSRNQKGFSPDVGCLLFQDKVPTKGKRHERLYRKISESTERSAFRIRSVSISRSIALNVRDGDEGILVGSRSGVAGLRRACRRNQPEGETGLFVSDGERLPTNKVSSFGQGG